LSAEGGAAGVPAAQGRATRREALLAATATAVFWLVGSAVVVVAQSGSDRRYAALAAAAAGIVTILASTWLTKDPGRRYVRSVVGATIATALTSDWMLWHFRVASSQGFQVDGLVKRITLPLLIVLLAPIVIRPLWAARRTVALRAARGMDLVMGAYATVVLVPALGIGLLHHNRLLYIAQDLGLVIFFVFMYLAGRVATADAARASAGEIVQALLALAVAKLVLFGWDISPLYSYVEAAAAAALALVLLRPRQAKLLPVAVAITLLAYDAVLIKHGTNSSTAVELAGALAVLVYLAVRARRLVPQWLVVALAIVAVVGFVGYTHDGAALRGQYRGPDASAVGTTFEAHQVRATVGHSPLSLALGRGLGGTVDESNAPYWFRVTLLSGGRDLTQVQEVHLLGYAVLLKEGLLGLAWLAIFLGTLAVLVFRALERAASRREPALVLYAALPLLGVIQAFAASSRVQSDPLNGLALGVLAGCLSAQPVAVRQAIVTHRRQLVAAALCTLAGCAAVVAVGPHFSSASSTATQTDTSTLPISLWIGDSYTAGAGASSGRYGEAIATSVELGWQTDLDAEGGTGFVAAGPRRRHHRVTEPVPLRLAGDAASFPGVAVVVIDAGRNDRGHPEAAIHRAVVSSFKTIAKDFPNAAVVVIAPFLMRSKPGDYLAIRRLERQQARKYRWAFVDPIAEGWIDRTSARLVKRDGIHPNQRGYDYLVAHLTPSIERALAKAHEVVRRHCTRATPCRRRAPRAR
jgi:lysophospholipase L1-like esterase